MINNVIFSLQNNNKLSKKIAQSLKTKKPKTPKFYTYLKSINPTFRADQLSTLATLIQVEFRSA